MPSGAVSFRPITALPQVGQNWDLVSIKMARQPDLWSC